MIELHHLSSGYPGHPVLEGLDLHIQKENLTVIVGPNGCGKSTLLKTIAGLLPMTGGELEIDGIPTKVIASAELAKKLTYLTQERPIPDITARRMVLHGRFPHLGYPRRYTQRDHEIVDEALARAKASDLADRMLPDLSGGERQKIYLAMALAQDTPILLLDEPTTYLDISHQFTVMELARSLVSEGKTVVMVLHDLPLALRYADNIVVLSDGKLAGKGKPEEIITSKVLDEVFHVRVHRVVLGQEPMYYCEKEA